METNDNNPVPVETFQGMVQRLFKKMGSPVLDLLHAAVGLAGEAGEYQLAILDHNLKNIPEELGDARFYLQAIFNQYGWTIEDFMDPIFNPPFAYSVRDTFMIKSTDVLDIVKKSWVYGKDMDDRKLYNEVGSVVGAYLDSVKSHGYSDEQIQYINMYKLTLSPTARYPLGYTDAAAIARADKVAEEAAAIAAAEASPFKSQVA